MVECFGLRGSGHNEHKKTLVKTLIRQGIEFRHLSLNEMMQLPGVHIPLEVSSKPTQQRHLLVQALDIQLLVTNLCPEKSKQLVSELVKLGFVVHCYLKYEPAIARKQVVNLRHKSAKIQKVERP